MKNETGRWMRAGMRAGIAFLMLLAVFPARTFAQGDPEPADSDTSPYHQAFLEYKAGNYEAARTAIDEAEKAHPHDMPIAVLKSRILAEQGDFADGEALLRRYLTDKGPVDVQEALGNLLLRKRDFTGAAGMYEQALEFKPGDPDIELKLIYAKINTGDLTTAMKYASGLKPLDPVNPSYYFAKAALAESSGNSAEADQDIQTVRTIYGITAANRYLKTYLEVFSGASKNSVNARSEPPKTTAPPPVPGQP